MATKKDKLMNSFFNDFEQDLIESEPPQKTTITVWLPCEYKKKFDHLQAVTKTKFGKRLQEMMMKAMDHAESKVSVPKPDELEL